MLRHVETLHCRPFGNDRNADPKRIPFMRLNFANSSNSLLVGNASGVLLPLPREGIITGGAVMHGTEFQTSLTIAQAAIRNAWLHGDAIDRAQLAIAENIVTEVLLQYTPEQPGLPDDLLGVITQIRQNPVRSEA